MLSRRRFAQAGEIGLAGAVGLAGYAGTVDDLPGTNARVRDDDPVVLLVHEPDIFVHVPPEITVVTVRGV